MGQRPLRADARRNIDALLEAAAAVFSSAGVDAPIRAIAAQAGVGIGTLYRHFPQRSDLIVAIMRREMDACANAARTLAEACAPGEAVARWMQCLVDLVAAKPRFAAALHSGDAAYEQLPVYLEQQLKPAFRKLLERAIAADEVRADVEVDDLLAAGKHLCIAADDTQGLARARRMVALLADGLRLRPSE